MKTLTYFIIAFTLMPFTVFAQQDGPNAPASTENQPLSSCTMCSGADWDSTENVVALDGQFASVTLQPYLNCFQSSCYFSRHLTCYNFGFNIPPTATIDGVSITVAGVPDANGAIHDRTIQLRRDNLNNLYGTNMAGNQPWNVNQPDHTYGSATELWGLTWAPADVNSSDFGCYIKLDNGSSNAHTVSVDAVFITVSYSIGLNTFSVTSSPQQVSIYNDATTQTLNVGVNLPSNSDVDITIVDLTGRACFTQRVNTTYGSAIAISTEFLTPGVYTCVVISGETRFSQKFVR